MTSEPKKRNHAAWIGPAIALIGLVTYFSHAAKIPDLRDSAVFNLVVVVVGVGVAGWGIFRKCNWKSILGLLTSGAFAALLVGYVFVLSNQLPDADLAVAAGAAAPPLELPDQTGRLVNIGDSLGRRVVVVFYRGFW